MLDGPAFGPANGGAAQKLVVLLHGVGADGQDLIGLAPHFAEALPDAEFAAPNAPNRAAMAPQGYQWFDLGFDGTSFKMATMVAGVQAAAPVLDGFLDEMLAARGLADQDLAVVGFSQGTMMALEVTLRRKAACAGVIGYSGMLLDGARLTAEITARPPVLLVHGDSDPVVPPQCLEMAATGLEQAGLAVDAHMRPGVGHGIDEGGLALGKQFLTTCFG